MLGSLCHVLVLVQSVVSLISNDGDTETTLILQDVKYLRNSSYVLNEVEQVGYSSPRFLYSSIICRGTFDLTPSSLPLQGTFGETVDLYSINLGPLCDLGVVPRRFVCTVEIPGKNRTRR